MTFEEGHKRVSETVELVESRLGDSPSVIGRNLLKASRELLEASPSGKIDPDRALMLAATAVEAAAKLLLSEKQKP